MSLDRKDLDLEESGEFDRESEREEADRPDFEREDSDRPGADGFERADSDRSDLDCLEGSDLDRLDSNRETGEFREFKAERDDFREEVGDGIGSRRRCNLTLFFSADGRENVRGDVDSPDLRVGGEKLC